MLITADYGKISAVILMSWIYVFDLEERKEWTWWEFEGTKADHCKKPESRAAAAALHCMGVEDLTYEPNGKPVAKNCYVSISHSGDHVAVCRNDTVPVGIDIEKMTERDFRKIANRFFRGKELEKFTENPTAETFYEIWTRKEAYSKILGTGVQEVVKGFDVYSLANCEFKTDFAGEYAVSVCEKIR